MPPARRRPPLRRRSCFQHHYVWFLSGPGQVSINCAHCPAVSKVVDLSLTYDTPLIQKQCKSSQDGHKAACKPKK